MNALISPQKLHFYCILFIGENILLKRMTVTLLTKKRLERATFLEHREQKIRLSNLTDIFVNRFHLHLCFCSVKFLNEHFHSLTNIGKEKITNKVNN